MTHSAALFRASNLRILDYPFAAALASALAICDEAVVVVGQSQDDTALIVQGLQNDYGCDRVKIVNTVFTFDLGWQERWWNTAVAQTDAEWLLWLDADEVIDPQAAPALKKLMRDPEIKLIRFPFVHLYATADYHIDFPLTHNTRLGRRSIGYRMVNLRNEANPNGAACAAVYGRNGTQRSAHSPHWPDVMTVDIPILHYGWCRDAHALAMSQTKQAAWYANGNGLQDGRIPDVQPHDYQLADMLESGRAHYFDGEHPDIVRPWLDEHTAVWHEMERYQYEI